MKVLFVSSGNKSNNPGKPGAVVYNQGESLKKQGVNIDYFLVKGKGFSGYFKNIRKLANEVKKNEYDLVHAHYSLSAFTATFAMFFNRSLPLIVSLMGSDAQLKGMNRLLVKFFSRFSWFKTIVKSKSMQKKLRIKDCSVIPNGVDINKINNIEKEIKSQRKNSIEETNTKNILFAADPEREAKNYPLAQKTMNLLNNATKLNVVYNTSHKKILEAILNTDVLLLTSRWEGSPNIIKEAMACNCPVVATDVGDVRWLFGNEPGHYICNFDPEDVSAKIKHALNFVKQNGRTNGRQRILELGLDAESVAERLVEVYEEAVER